MGAAAIEIDGRNYSTNSVQTVMTRTQCRRAQRAHSLACYKIGALQRSIHHQEATALLDLDGSKDGSLLLHSVAIHRSDCSALQRNVHYEDSSGWPGLIKIQVSTGGRHHYNVAHRYWE